MENIHLDFEGAKAKHLLFKSRLRSILYGAAIDETPVLSHHECTVGKWIYEHALEAYGNIPEMIELEKVHAEIHTAARSLVKLYKEGKVHAARAGLNGMEKIADKLVALLSVVERKIEAAPASSRQTPYQPVDVSLKELEELAQVNKELDRVIRDQSGALSNERQLLTDVFEQLPAQVSILKGPDHVFELVNPAAQALLGDKKVVGKSAKEVFPELEEFGYFQLLDRVYQTGEPHRGTEMPARIVNGDGSIEELFVDIAYLPLRKDDGEIEGVISFSVDVTEAVAGRKAAQQNEERFRFMADAMPVQVWTADADGALDYVNKRTEHFFGRSAVGIIGDGWKAVVHPDDLGVAVERWIHSLQTLEPYEVEFRLKNVDGDYRWHLARANAFTGADKAAKWFGTNTDIHEMKTMQDRLKQSYEDLEVKVTFRNIELERANRELQKKLEVLGARN